MHGVMSRVTVAITHIKGQKPYYLTTHEPKQYPDSPMPDNEGI